jgi:AcrR family transcriptional regulator
MNILECAILLFKEYGYDQVTILQICEKAKVAKSTFYYHYETKEDLIKDFFKTTDINVEQIMQVFLEDVNCLEQMWKMIELYYKRLLEAGIEITKVVYLTNLIHDKHILGEDNAIAKEAYLTLLNRAMENKLIIKTKKDAEELLSALVYSLTGIAYLWCVKNASFDLLKECRDAFETVLGYEA